jgi:hypothetical protein
MAEGEKIVFAPQAGPQEEFLSGIKMGVDSGLPMRG